MHKACIVQRAIKNSFKKPYRKKLEKTEIDDRENLHHCQGLKKKFTKIEHIKIRL